MHSHILPIQPGETKEILVLMQAMKEEPPADAKSKDKFLVQSFLVATTGDVLTDLQKPNIDTVKRWMVSECSDQLVDRS